MYRQKDHEQRTTIMKKIIPASVLTLGIALTSLALPSVAHAPVGVPEVVEAPQSIEVASQPPESVIVAPEAAPEPVATVSVDILGHQSEIDACEGPVLSEYATGPVIGEHNHCGGAYVLDLEPGDIVDIDGYYDALYVVTEVRDVPKGASIDVLDFAYLYLQTCYFSPREDMRLVGLERVSE